MPRFSETVMDHFQSPRNEGRMEAADRVGMAGVPGQGRYVILYVRLHGDRVTASQFQSHGCGATIASASMLTELVQGRTLGECRALARDDVLAALGGLPPDKRHCVDFVLDSLAEIVIEDPDERRPDATGDV